MSWIERSIEERLAHAARNGELAVPHLEGKPLGDLDRQRSQGWWAEQFVARELSHDRRKAAVSAAAAARAEFWRADSAETLHARVRAANTAISAANVNLVDSDRLALFDVADVESRWRALHATP